LHKNYKYIHTTVLTGTVKIGRKTHVVSVHCSIYTVSKNNGSLKQAGLTSSKQASFVMIFHNDKMHRHLTAD